MADVGEPGDQPEVHEVCGRKGKPKFAHAPLQRLKARAKQRGQCGSAVGRPKQHKRQPRGGLQGHVRAPGSPAPTAANTAAAGAMAAPKAPTIQSAVDRFFRRGGPVVVPGRTLDAPGNPPTAFPATQACAA
jgi:hypothetical protein